MLSTLQLRAYWHVLSFQRHLTKTHVQLIRACRSDKIVTLDLTYFVIQSQPLEASLLIYKFCKTTTGLFCVLNFFFSIVNSLCLKDSIPECSVDTPELGGMPGLSKDIEMDYSSDSNSAIEITQPDYGDEVATLRQLIQTLTQTVQRNEHRIQGTGSPCPLVT